MKKLAGPLLFLLAGIAVGAVVARFSNRPASGPGVQPAPATAALPVAGALSERAIHPTVDAGPTNFPPRGATHISAPPATPDTNPPPTPAIPPRAATPPPVLSAQVAPQAEAAAVEEPYHRVFVLCIGIDDYANGWPRLTYAEKDANDVGNALSRRFNFTVQKLTGTAATKEQITAAMERLRDKMSGEDDLLVFFSGHGHTLDVPGTGTNAAARFTRAGFLIPYGTRPLPRDSYSSLQERALDMREFARTLGGLRARHRILVLDACFSGFAAGVASPQNKLANDSVRELLHQPTVQIITAGQDTEEAPDKGLKDDQGRAIENGLLTHAFLKVLAARQILTVDEIYFPMRAEVRNRAEKHGRSLNPQRRYLLASSGDFVFIPAELKHRWTQPRSVSGSQVVVNRSYTEPVTEAEVAQVEAEALKGPRENDLAWSNKLDRMEARASTGDANAMAALVRMWGAGLGAKRDDRKAYRWAREGFDTATPAGKVALGTALLHGYGMPRNQQEAAGYLGDAGIDLLKGMGVTQNKEIENLIKPFLPEGPGSGSKKPDGKRNPFDAIKGIFSGNGSGGSANRNPLKSAENRAAKLQAQLDKSDYKGVKNELRGWKAELDKSSGAELPAQTRPALDALKRHVNEMHAKAEEDFYKATLQKTLNQLREELKKIPGSRP